MRAHLGRRYVELPSLPRTCLGLGQTSSLTAHVLPFCWLSIRYKLEDEGKKDSEEYKALGAKFGMFHGASSFVNLGALVGAFVYSWDLASMLPV